MAFITHGELVSIINAAEAHGRQQARNPCDKIFSFKWLDPECVEGGCQSRTKFARGAQQMRRQVLDITNLAESHYSVSWVANQIRALPDKELSH